MLGMMNKGSSGSDLAQLIPSRAQALQKPGMGAPQGPGMPQGMGMNQGLAALFSGDQAAAPAGAQSQLPQIMAPQTPNIGMPPRPQMPVQASGASWVNPFLPNGRVDMSTAIGRMIGRRDIGNSR